MRRAERIRGLCEKHFSSSSSRDEDFLGFFLGSNEVRFNDHGEKLPTSIDTKARFDTPDTSVDSRICLNREQGHNRPIPDSLLVAERTQETRDENMYSRGVSDVFLELDIIARVGSLYQKAHRC